MNRCHCNFGFNRDQSLKLSLSNEIPGLVDRPTAAACTPVIDDQQTQGSSKFDGQCGPPSNPGSLDTRVSIETE